MKTPARKSANKRPRQQAPCIDYDKAAAKVLKEARRKDGRAPDDVALAVGRRYGCKGSRRASGF